jgi:hypothetical protein
MSSRVAAGRLLGDRGSDFDVPLGMSLARVAEMDGLEWSAVRLGSCALGAVACSRPGTKGVPGPFVTNVSQVSINLQTKQWFRATSVL